jgi:hypothetical protein
LAAATTAFLIGGGGKRLSTFVDDDDDNYPGFWHPSFYYSKQFLALLIVPLNVAAAKRALRAINILSALVSGWH